MQLNKLLNLHQDANGVSLQKLLTSESSDIQLKELANRLCLRLEPIVFKDELRNLPKPTEKRNYNYIIHLRSPAHWTSLMIDNRNHRAYYFNSFANYFGDIPQEVLDFVKRAGCKLYFTDSPIQDANRGYCGQYCVLWLSFINRPSNDLKDFNDYLNLFKDMTTEILKYKKKHGSELNY